MHVVAPGRAPEQVPLLQLKPPEHRFPAQHAAPEVPQPGAWQAALLQLKPEEHALPFVQHSACSVPHGSVGPGHPRNPTERRAKRDVNDHRLKLIVCPFRRARGTMPRHAASFNPTFGAADDPLRRGLPRSGYDQTPICDRLGTASNDAAYPMETTAVPAGCRFAIDMPFRRAPWPGHVRMQFGGGQVG